MAKLKSIYYNKNVVAHGEYILRVNGSNILYALTEDVLSGTDTWTSLAAGGAVAGIASSSYLNGWFVAAGGTVGQLEGLNITNKKVLDATESFVGIVAYDDDNILAYGNAIYRTRNGGRSWEKITTPSAVSALALVRNILYIGTDNSDTADYAGSSFYYSKNNGKSWTSVAYPKKVWKVNDLRYATNVTAYAVTIHEDDSVPAVRLSYLTRSTDGGKTFQVQDTGFSATEVEWLQLAVEPNNANSVYAIGMLASDDSLVIVKGS